MCRGAARVLRTAGDGRPMTIDGRGRLYVPVWLRRERGAPWLLVGTHFATSTVVVAPISALDEIGDRVLGKAL